VVEIEARETRIKELEAKIAGAAATRDGKQTLAFEGAVPVSALLGDEASYLRMASPRGKSD